MGLLAATVALAAALSVTLAPGHPRQQLAARHARLLPVVHPNSSPTAKASAQRSSPPPPQSTPPIRTLPWTQLTGYAPPPYVPEAAVQAVALKAADAMGGGRIIRTELETLTAAGHAIGDTVSPSNVSRARMVWLLWIVGTWQGGCLTTDCPAQPDTLYYAMFDAKTGTSFGYGTGFHMPGAPAVRKGVHLGNST